MIPIDQSCIFIIESAENKTIIVQRWIVHIQQVLII